MNKRLLPVLRRARALATAGLALLAAAAAQAEPARWLLLASDAGLTMLTRRGLA